MLRLRSPASIRDCIDRVIKHQQAVSPRASHTPAHVGRQDQEPIVRSRGAGWIGVLLDVLVGQVRMARGELGVDRSDKIRWDGDVTRRWPALAAHPSPSALSKPFTSSRKRTSLSGFKVVAQATPCGMPTARSRSF